MIPRSVSGGLLLTRRSDSIGVPKPAADARISGQAIDLSRLKGMGDNDTTGDELIQGGLHRDLILLDPPSSDSLGGIHGGLVLEQEEDDVLTQGICIQGGFDGGHQTSALRGIQPQFEILNRQSRQRRDKNAKATMTLGRKPTKRLNAP